MNFALNKNNFYQSLILGLLLILMFFSREIANTLITSVFFAYLFSPLVDRLKVLPRGVVSGIIVLTIVLIVVGIVVLLIPAISDQITKLIKSIPPYLKKLYDKIPGSTILKLIGFDFNFVVETLGKFNKQLLSLSGEIFSNILKSGSAIINAVVGLMLTPLLSFYFLRDKEKIASEAKYLLPNHPIMKRIIYEVDDIIAGFIRGQLLVCMVMSVCYSIALSLIGLKYSLLIGLVTGLLSFIPYFGVGVGLTISLITAWFDSWFTVGAVALVFAVLQVIETVYIAPKLLGDKLGMHPAIVIMSLLIGANVGGIIGMITSVPITAFILVLLKILAELRDENQKEYAASSVSPYQQEI